MAQQALPPIRRIERTTMNDPTTIQTEPKRDSYATAVQITALVVLVFLGISGVRFLNGLAEQSRAESAARIEATKTAKTPDTEPDAPRTVETGRAVDAAPAVGVVRQGEVHEHYVGKCPACHTITVFDPKDVSTIVFTLDVERSARCGNPTCRALIDVEPVGSTKGRKLMAEAGR